MTANKSNMFTLRATARVAQQSRKLVII